MQAYAGLWAANSRHSQPDQACYMLHCSWLNVAPSLAVRKGRVSAAGGASRQIQTQPWLPSASVGCKQSPHGKIDHTQVLCVGAMAGTQQSLRPALTDTTSEEICSLLPAEVQVFDWAAGARRAWRAALNSTGKPTALGSPATCFASISLSEAAPHTGALLS